MLKLIRSATGNTDMSKTFEAIVEIDETYVGGKPRKDNHSDDDNNFPKPPLKRRRRTRKTPIVGIKNAIPNAFTLKNISQYARG
jgi:hypothetical protein